MVEGIQLIDGSAPTLQCEPCKRAKVTEKTFPSESATLHADTYGSRIHSNVWGPALVKSIGGREYMLTFTDEHSREVSLYFLAKKSDMFVTYKQFKAWVSTHRQAIIKTLCTDRGGKYMLHAFENYLQACGTKHELTVHDSPSQNGVTERLNRTLVSWMCACMLATNLPKSLWAEALQYLAWTKNRTPTCTLTNKTLHEMVTGNKPDLRNIHTWGSRVFVLIEGQGKLDVQADAAFFVGYDGQSKGYRVYWPGKRSVTCERNVRWDERDPALLEGETVTVNQPEPQVPYTNRLRSADKDPMILTALQSRHAANAAVAFDSAAMWEINTGVMGPSGAYWALTREIVREPRNVEDAKHLLW